jgi:hypothetical protein
VYIRSKTTVYISKTVCRKRCSHLYGNSNKINEQPKQKSCNLPMQQMNGDDPFAFGPALLMVMESDVGSSVK